MNFAVVCMVMSLFCGVAFARTYNRPDRVQYMNEHCSIPDMRDQEEAVSDEVTSGDLLRAYGSSNIDEWRVVLLNQVNDVINGNVDAPPVDVVQADYKNAVCSLGLVLQLANQVLQIGGTPAICKDVDTSDADSIHGCLATDIDHLKANLDSMAGATDMDHAGEYFWRIEQTLNRIQQSLSYLMQIEQNTGDFVGMDWPFIDEHCVPVEEIMGELQDNTPLTIHEMHEHVAGANVEDWLTDLKAGVDNPSSTDQAWREEKHKQVVCSLASLFNLGNHIMEGGEVDVCVGKEVDVSDINQVAQCLLENISEMEELSQQLTAMDENSSLEEVSVVITNMVFPLDRIQHGIWLTAQDLGSDV